MRHATIALMMMTTLTLAAGLSLAADEPAAAPDKPVAAEAVAEKPAAEGDPLATHITAVKGLVQVRQGEDQPWQIAKAGMKLNPGAEFRTGPRSMVQFKVGDTQTITLDRLGVIKVVDAIRAGGKIRTDLGMKYGRSELHVEAGGVEHESRIHAPGSTLAVRGSSGVLQSDAFSNVAYCTEHEAEAQMEDRLGRIVFFQMPQPVIVDSEHGDPIRTALLSDAYNPQSLGATPNERELFAANPDGKFLFDSYLGNGGVDQNRDLASTLDQFDDLSHMGGGNGNGGGGMMGGTFTSGVLSVSAAFQSLDIMSPADVNLILSIPGQGNFGASSVDPNGVFMHGGDQFSVNSSDIAAEGINGNSMTMLPIGSYTAVLQNLGPADATILSIQAQGATGGGGNQVFAQQAGATILSGQSINVPFTVPAATP